MASGSNMGSLPVFLVSIMLPLMLQVLWLLPPSVVAQTAASAPTGSSSTGPANSTVPDTPGTVSLQLYYPVNQQPNQSYAQTQVDIIGSGGIQTGLDPEIARYFNRSGPVDIFSPDNYTQIVPGQIALITCDPDNYQQGRFIIGLDVFVTMVSGMVFANGSIADAGSSSNAQPGAVILYSIESDMCTWDQPSNSTIFTTTDKNMAQWLTRIMAQPEYRNHTGFIAHWQTAPSYNQPSDGGSASPPPPSTTIAMIVLYSITGCITFLFLLIIVLGAIRAHRHPERYGPRNMLGMTRQSRARGMARAMLDTIPIIKFGENEQPKSSQTAGQGQHGDVELAAQPSSEQQTPSSMPAVKEAEANVVESAVAPGQEKIAPTTAIVAESSASNIEKAGAANALEDKEMKVTEASSEDATVPANVPGASTVQVQPAMTQASENNGEGAVSCPICTEDFVRGEPARLLPCRHHFHPACIDPWLLNVSSTCPMCRVDLNPPSEGENDDEEEGGYTRQDIIEAERIAAAAAANRNRSARQWPYGSHNDREVREQNARRVIMSGLGFMNINSMSQADPEERLQALRQVRAARLAREERRRREAGSSGATATTLGRLGRIFHRSNQHSSTESPGSSQNAGQANSAASAQQENQQSSSTRSPEQRQR